MVLQALMSNQHKKGNSLKYLLKVSLLSPGINAGENYRCTSIIMRHASQADPMAELNSDPESN